MLIDNKVAIITGGASGIGLHFAVELLKNNLKAVTLADVDPAKGQEAVDKITKEFGASKVLFVKTDVTVQKEMEEAFKKTVEQFGNLDIVINNAGIFADNIWEKEVAINVNGTIRGSFLAMEEYLPKYKSGDEGVIVNIASIAGLLNWPCFPVYIAAKHAVVGLGRSLGGPHQYEMTKVRVVTICPGVTKTPLLDNIDKKLLNERYEQLYKRIPIDDYPVQSPDVVAKCLLKVVKEAATGSIWVVEDSEIYEVDIPERQEMKKA